MIDFTEGRSGRDKYRGGGREKVEKIVNSQLSRSDKTYSPPTVLNARLATFVPTPSVDLSLIVACTCEGNIVGACEESHLKFMIRVRGSYFQLLSNFISSDNSREINIWQAHYS